MSEETIRYSVTGATSEQIIAIGGKNTKSTRHGDIVFASLTKDQVNKLRSQGYTVDELARVEAASPTAVIDIGEEVEPPTPIEGEPLYTPSAIFAQLGFEEARKLTDPMLYGEGINIAIIDSGIRKSHVDIGEDSIVYEHDYTDETNPNPSDVFDHGTGVAHILRVAVPNSGILNLKILNNQGLGSPEDLVMAIDDCMSMHDDQLEYAPKIINLSLGIPYHQTSGYSDPVRVICREAISRNIWLIAAAGNAGPNPNTVMVPALEKHVLAVGSCRFDPFEVSFWSSRGPSNESPYIQKPDTVFLGENLLVASGKGDTARVAKGGTSFATPFVAGLCAMYQEAALIHQSVRYPEHLFGPLDLWELIRMEDLIDEHLIKFCVKPEYAGQGKDNNYGNGLPYGPLFTETIAPKPTRVFDASVMVTPMITLSMLSMLVKMMR